MVTRWAPLIALVLTACAATPAREAAPTGIVSLNPCTDAILAEVADPQQILGLSSYSSDPAASSMDVAKALRFRAVSGSAEEVAALRPALVIGSTFTAPSARSAFARMGLRFAAFGIATNVAESKAQVREIAMLAGHPERGDWLNAQIDAALAEATPPPGPLVPAIVWQSGGMVPGAGTLIADLLARTGFINAAALRGMQQADLLPLEQMLAAPPRVIFTAGNPLANEDRMLAHPALRALTGTLRAPLNPALLWCGGPSIPRTVARLAQVRREVSRRPGLDPGPLAPRREAGLMRPAVPAFAGTTN